ncbi:MAG: class II fructose-bisphosphate aldolase [Candidatus Lambdaproteobacteria bacterium RIFOXYD2_FULL_56_26]|uniref:Fructose-bisphosphate aldolase n=1 Tax=Candidatus Lambdaproteobacteria bacterium RIFOXYD2_FULL_56_26 TaxID=1817773 RepID=A0A1F6H2T8_9PROT|nr:MAG: class II fructose-bisphosphate aldolase [Candidatus Lambdaproteobacteria bacterium RIFOXYD2_FULL_56_26]
MPVVNFQQYCKMLDTAKENHYAYPAINVSSIATANAVLKGLADAGSDGIIQVSTGGGEFASGSNVKDMALGAISLAQHVHLMAERYNVFVALHTDHCQPGKLDTFVRPLIEETKRRRQKGLPNLFNSHMFDGSELPMVENMQIAESLLEECATVEIILEVETGVVGGEEDGVSHEGAPAEKLFTTPEDMLYAYEKLSKKGRFMLAATFGNVHGVYKPGNVKLKPAILKQGQDALTKKYGKDARLDLVFHGGSGSTLEEIRETLDYGVVKMNIDTDTQYAFTRPIVDHMFKNYDGMLKIDGEVGNKKYYDPRAYMKKGEAGMAERVGVGASDLRSKGRTLFHK